MAMKRKTKKAISFVFHMTIYVFAWHLFRNENLPNVGFGLIFFFNLLNYSAALMNYDLYFAMKKLVENYEIMTNGLSKQVNDAVEIIKEKDESFKQLRTKYILSESQNMQIREMNDRLHEVNQTVVNQRSH